MFSLFTPPPHEHPVLGTMHWRSGHWRTAVALVGGDPTPLILAGSRKKPDDAAISEALALPELLVKHRQQIASALFEHFEPYDDAHTDRRLIDEDGELPGIRNPRDALEESELVAVLVKPLDGVMTVEFCFTTTWDREHTLGARFQRGEWLELCGSTLVP
ncbi:hypothetical protein PY257_15900 [Ramlibacter sp. H39-3-26]|uniref:DUF6985 domain-containing protein n=1 Tax=Curvibacter soli TaxID=3031331 RepID=UPI0023DC59B9|nr:hypothetical protein [Ramlibacter sp. H39-3-26]MDF1486643.1 hypothetical protein [Ramlibacter sp. H39-3-26]